jgi:hypothetical protein
VAKSRKAWQTMELYPTWISEVHQTYPGHMISICACRECLGHPISKKNKVKILFFEWVITGIKVLTTNWLQITTTNWPQVDYKLVDNMATSWLDIGWLQSWLQVENNELITAKWITLLSLFYPNPPTLAGYKWRYELITEWTPVALFYLLHPNNNNNNPHLTLL